MIWDILLIASLCLLLAAASPIQQVVISVDANTQPVPLGWLDPRLNGGRFLDFTTPDGGEPLNVIISGLSDPYILTESGFLEYSKSIGFSKECLGLHYGHLHEADLGDGDGRKIEQILARQSYFPIWGTCWESLAGGNHFRAWKQNGTLGNSGAWFLAASKEEDARGHHKIVPNGYNLGRDWLVANAIYGSRWKGQWWKAKVEWRSDLLAPGSDGVNHGIPQDGRVAVLTVYRRRDSTYQDYLTTEIPLRLLETITLTYISNILTTILTIFLPYLDYALL